MGKAITQSKQRVVGDFNLTWDELIDRLSLGNSGR
jgi:hypothetical protein